jgi:hypothetical protein
VKQKFNLLKQNAMKTTKLISALTLGIILTGTVIAFAGNPHLNRVYPQGAHSIVYEVLIHQPDNGLAHNSYLVQLIDQAGRSVSPAQKYVAGVSQYNFYEEGPVTGVRIARMVLVGNNDSSAGFSGLTCKKDVKAGTFKNGSVYIFNLYPQSISPDKQ